MIAREDFLERATFCVRLAASVAEPSYKIMLLDMAQFWKDQAERVGGAERAAPGEPRYPARAAQNGAG